MIGWQNIFKPAILVQIQEFWRMFNLKRKNPGVLQGFRPWYFLQKTKHIEIQLDKAKRASQIQEAQDLEYNRQIILTLLDIAKKLATWIFQKRRIRQVLDKRKISCQQLCDVV